jgi:hypothetical protein
MDRETRLKLIARYLSESGELPVGWTEDDERTWSELKARETAPGKVTPTEQEKAERKQCIRQFQTATSNKERHEILRDFIEQHFESAIVWPWFQERRDALTQAGMPLYGQVDAVKKEPSGKAPSPVIELTEREKKIWKVIQRGSTGPTYCRELDNAGIEPLRSGIWKVCPSRKYASVYQADEPWRHRIQDEKSKVQRKARLAGLAS